MVIERNIFTRKLRVPPKFNQHFEVPVATEWGIIAVNEFLLCLKDKDVDPSLKQQFSAALAKRYVEQTFKRGYKLWFDDSDAIVALGRGIERGKDGKVAQTGPTNSIFQPNRNRPDMVRVELNKHLDNVFLNPASSLKDDLSVLESEMYRTLMDMSKAPLATPAPAPAAGKQKTSNASSSSSSASSSRASTPYARPTAASMPAVEAKTRKVSYGSFWKEFLQSPQDHFEFESPREDAKNPDSIQTRVPAWSADGLIMYSMPVADGSIAVGTYSDRVDGGLLTDHRSWAMTFGSGREDKNLHFDDIGRGVDNEVLVVRVDNDAELDAVRTRMAALRIPDAVVSSLTEGRSVIRRPLVSNREKRQQIDPRHNDRWVGWLDYRRLVIEVTGMLEMAKMGMAPHIYGLAIVKDNRPLDGPYQGKWITMYQVITVMERGDSFTNRLAQVQGSSGDTGTKEVLQQLLKLVFSYSTCRIYVLDAKPDNLIVRMGSTQPLVIDMDSYFFRYAYPPQVARTIESTPFSDWKVVWFVNMMLLSMMLKMSMNEADFRAMWWTARVQAAMRSVLRQAIACTPVNDKTEPGFCVAAATLTDMKFVGAPNYQGHGRRASSNTDADAIRNTTVEQTVHYTLIYTYSMMHTYFARKFAATWTRPDADSAEAQAERESLRPFYEFSIARMLPTAKYFKKALNPEAMRQSAKNLPALMLRYFDMSQKDLSALVDTAKPFDELVRRKEKNPKVLTGFTWVP